MLQTHLLPGPFASCLIEQSSFFLLLSISPSRPLPLILRNRGESVRRSRVKSTHETAYKDEQWKLYIECVELHSSPMMRSLLLIFRSQRRIEATWFTRACVPSVSTIAAVGEVVSVSKQLTSAWWFPDPVRNVGTFNVQRIV